MPHSYPPGTRTGNYFFDTADFYGLGHSETLLGEEIGTRQDCVIATKVGHRLDASGNIYFDYSKKYILNACEQSLIRLRRDTIDFYHYIPPGCLISNKGNVLKRWNSFGNREKSGTGVSL
ncbi:MAG: aldo/keto reductase [Lewinellaceae bacterium]|nr:aldo/keto reductase [Lewinellaceae bacterium]